MDNHNFKKKRMKLVSDSNYYMDSFRQNVRMYDLPLRELSEKSGIPYDTLKSFLYGSAADCKLSLAVKLARALGCSVDELVGAETVSKDIRESVAMLDLMPPQFSKYVKWVINNNFIRMNTQPLDRFVPVMEAEFDSNLKATTLIVTTEVKAPEDIIFKTFLAIRMPCDNYVPYYYKDDILFIANDRKPKKSEQIVVAHNKDFWIVPNETFKNKENYYIGYVAYVERRL